MLNPNPKPSPNQVLSCSQQLPTEAALSLPHGRDGVVCAEAGPHPPLSRDMLYYVADLLPMCSTLLTLKVRVRLWVRLRVRLRLRGGGRPNVTR